MLIEFVNSTQINAQCTKMGSKTKGRTTQRIGRAHTIDGFVADRPLAIEPISNPALAMKKISDTALHRIIAALIPTPNWDLVGLPPHQNAKGDRHGDKTTSAIFRRRGTRDCFSLPTAD